jgi:transcriptional regulator with XRE-family HTH domain
MSTLTATKLPEIWMEVIDPKRIAKLMAIQEVSGRAVSENAGWKSHTYLQRILKGQAKNVEPEHAVRIAYFLGVGTDDLFVARTSSDARETAKWERKLKPRRRAA